MAAKRDGNLQPEIGRDLCRVRTKGGNYRGYKKYILTENLSERDNAVFVCPRCKGILRDLCLSTDGEQFCSCCKKEGEQTNPNIHMNNTILCFKCSCPLMLRGCSWLGTLGDCENHLDTCGYVQETCKLKCGVVLQRNDHVTHVKENCVQRIVKCEHCEKNFKFCGLSKHLNVCPKMRVSCELKCGMEMCRDEVTQHMEKECGQVVESCKLGCGVELTRNKLKIHVTDKCVQRVVTCEHCEKNFKFCELPEHLDLCPKMKVSCELNCGVLVFREELTKHIDRDCKEKEIECPFIKYKCVRLIKRQDLNTHLKEKETEHLKLKLDAIEDIVMKQSELIEKQNRNIERISQENSSLKMIEKQLKNLLYPIKFHWEIKTYKQNKYVLTQKQFEAAGYILHFDHIYQDDILQIGFCLKDGKDDDKLGWPFRAKFITSSTVSYLPRAPESETKEFKSDVIQVERGDVSSEFRIACVPISSSFRPGLLGPSTVSLDISVVFCLLD